MLKKEMSGLTASKLRILLIGLIVLIFALCIGGFWYFHNQLSTYAAQVQSDNATAALSSDDITKLQAIKNQLVQDNVAVTRAKNIVADSQYYQYQNQIISDLNTYAKNSGITISSYVFADTSATAGAAAPTAAAAIGTPPPAGLKSITASVAVKSPVSYKAIMKFTHAIELNLTKMQLSGIAMTGSTTNPDEVTVNPLTIEVYTR